MSETLNPLIHQTMELLAEARSHFDASVSGPVRYSFLPVTDSTADVTWSGYAYRGAGYLTEKGRFSRYGEEPTFSPEWLDHLSGEDHQKIAVFVRNHKESFWAIDGLFTSIIHQCLSNNPHYKHLLRNFILLWDSTTSHTLSESTEDCYSLHAIQGIGGVDVSSLDAKEQARYRALAGFAVDAYLNCFYGNRHRPTSDDSPRCVNEVVYPGHYEVEEPYRALVLTYHEQAEPLIEYLKRGYRGQELEEMLANNTPATMSVGVL